MRSALDHFTTSARALGLNVPHHPAELRGTALFQDHLALRAQAKARIDQYAGRFAGMVSSAQGRTDAQGKPITAERVARSQAERWEWATALAQLGHDNVRADSLVPMASQALTYFYSGVVEVMHANLPAWEGKILPIDRRPDRAAENFVWYEYDLVGIAKAVSTYAQKDIPMVNGPIGQANYGAIVPFLCGMEVNFMDNRRSALAKLNGKPDFQVEQNKAKMCVRAIAEAINFLWLFGDPVLGIEGLMNNSKIGMLTLVGAWAAKTPLQILDDLSSMITIIPNATQGQLGDMSRIKIFLPPEQYNLANSQPVTSAGSGTILDFFKKSWSLRDDQIIREYSFAAANSQIYIGGPQGLQRDRAVVFYDQGDIDRDPSFVLSQDIEVPMAPRMNGLSETTYYHARAGGCKIPDARGIRYVEGL